MMGRDDEDVHPCSSSSSTDSNYNNNNNYGRHYDIDSRSVASCSSSSLSSSSRNKKNGYSSKDLSSDLKLGLSISSLSPFHDLSSTPRGQYSDWPPIKAQLRNTLAVKSNSRLFIDSSLFVKVYMEGIPIGRKLNLLDHHSYLPLITTLSQMFNTTILFPHVVCDNLSEENHVHVLTYEDKEGDWMMVGDVPWELFLTTVTRLKIAALGKCLQKHSTNLT